MLKEYKRLRRMRQDYFAVHGEYADRHWIKPISTYFPPNQNKFRSYKIFLLNMTESAKKTSHPTDPLKAQ